MDTLDTARFDRSVARLRELTAQGADIIHADTAIGAGAMSGWRELNGGELLPGDIVWQPGSDAAYLWHHSCGPQMPGHEGHRYAFTLVRPARHAYDVVVSLLYENDDLAWLTERLDDIMS